MLVFENRLCWRQRAGQRWLAQVFEGVDDMKPDMTDGNRDMFHATLQKTGQWRSQGLRRCRAGRLRCVFRRGQHEGVRLHGAYALDYASRNGGPARSTGSPCPKVNDLNNWLFLIRDYREWHAGRHRRVPAWRARPMRWTRRTARGFFSVFDNTVEARSTSDHLPLRDARFRADRGRQGCGGVLWPVR